MSEVELSATEFPDAHVVVVGPEDRLVLLWEDPLDDATTESVLDTLKAQGLDERTIVVSGAVRLGVLRG